eukprot:m51a1_g13256 putative yeats family protein isoform 3 (206) ;mRNA; f:996-1689
MATPAPGRKRMKGVVMSKPIVTGTVAYALPNPQSDRTHRWTCYLRGLQHEDLSPIIRRVEFVLHHTFENPKRVIESPPFLVTEHGWGEFDIAITIYFVEAAMEKPITLYHPLKLFERHASGGTPIVDPIVVGERYDELVFRDPTEDMNRRLNAPLVPLPVPDQLQPVESKTAFDDTEDRRKVEEASAEIQRQINALKEKLVAPQL